MSYPRRTLAAMTTATEREALLRRVRYAADAAYSEGIAETEILAAVHAGIVNARATAALFDEDGDGIADYVQRAA